MEKSKELTGNKLWEAIQKKAKWREEKVEILENHLMQGVITFKNEDRGQEAIVHPSSKKKNVFQFTFFDRFGPVGDCEACNVRELAIKIQEYGFIACEEKDFSLTELATREESKEKIKKRKVRIYER